MEVNIPLLKTGANPNVLVIILVPQFHDTPDLELSFSLEDASCKALNVIISVQHTI